MTSLTASKFYGPVFIGVVFNLMLYGILLVQMYLYFTLYKHDRKLTKALVLTLLALDTANTCLVCTYLYDPLVKRHASVDALIRGDKFWAADPAVTGAIATLVQLFFARRVMILTSNKLITGIIVVGSIIQLLSALGCAIWLLRDLVYADFQKVKVVAIIYLLSAALVDIIITATLVWYLRKSKTGVASTDALIGRVIRLTIRTGLVTSIAAIADLGFYLASTTTWHLVFNLPLPKLYSNAMMSSLNARRGWESREHTSRQQPVMLAGDMFAPVSIQLQTAHEILLDVSESPEGMSDTAYTSQNTQASDPHCGRDEKTRSPVSPIMEPPKALKGPPECV